MSLNEFKSELCLFFLRSLKVIVNKFRNNFCKSLIAKLIDVID